MKIYLITNTVNGKRYVGKTKYADITKRFEQHIRESRKAPRKHITLYAAIRKYGNDAFVIEELDTASTMKELAQKEGMWVAKLNTYPHEYNMTRGGDGGSYTRSPEVREKMRQQTLGRDDDFWKRQKNASTRANQRPEFREKMSAAMKKYYSTHEHPRSGKHHSDEVRQKMSESAKIRDNTNIGKHARTPEMRKKVSEGRKGKGTDSQNAMSDPLNRAKVAASKVGRRLHIGPNGERKMFVPNTAPDGFVLQ